MFLGVFELLVLFLVPVVLLAVVVGVVVVATARSEATLTPEVAGARRHAVTTSAVSALLMLGAPAAARPARRGDHGRRPRRPALPDVGARPRPRPARRRPGRALRPAGRRAHLAAADRHLAHRPAPGPVAAQPAPGRLAPGRRDDHRAGGVRRRRAGGRRVRTGDPAPARRRRRDRGPLPGVGLRRAAADRAPPLRARRRPDAACRAAPLGGGHRRRGQRPAAAPRLRRPGVPGSHRGRSGHARPGPVPGRRGRGPRLRRRRMAHRGRGADGTAPFLVLAGLVVLVLPVPRLPAVSAYAVPPAPSVPMGSA